MRSPHPSARGSSPTWARVIKVERPDSGDFARAYDERVKGMASPFVWSNRSKKSLTLDLKHPDAQQPPARTATRRPTTCSFKASGSIAGSPDEPAKAGCSIADVAAGMYACSSMLAALKDPAVVAKLDELGPAEPDPRRSLEGDEGRDEDF